MSKLRFRYALEPVLLTRKWDLDKLMQALGQHNGVIAEHAVLEAALQEKIAGAATAWMTMTASATFQSVDTFVLSTRYMADLSRQARDQAKRREELEALRDELIDSVVRAQRSVDAAEQHRDEMKALFVQQRLSGDFKIADDQWNTLQSGAASNGS